MKLYDSIPGPKEAPIGNPCIAFEKFDGSNIRAEYNRKNGWHKFGTRHRLLDPNEQPLGAAIKCFMERYSEPLTKIIRNDKLWRERAT